MECLFTQTDVSYLLFVCAADAIASAERQERSESHLLELNSAKNVSKVAHELGIDSESSKKLALAAVSDAHTRQKSKGQMFREFLERFGANHLNGPAIFNEELLSIFKISDEGEAIAKAWEARGGYVHTAHPFKEVSLAGTTSGISPKALFDVMIGNKTAPSILWLERLVAQSIRTYIEMGEEASGKPS